MGTQSFGKYQLVKKLATGGMAEVWLARQTGIEGFNRTVVLKRILPHLAEDPEFVQMFLNEARVAAKFNHPNIAQIYELGEENNTYFIAMEYIHGEDLGRVMRKAWSTGQWIAQPLAIRIVAACCEGLAYAHNRTDDHGRPLRVVHRDISPQNILISFDGSVKLVDFGIAKAADLPSMTKSGAIKGKFAYMAPEQAAGKPLDHRSDIFAIGLVLYELLTGVRPLKRDNEIATLQAALECAIEAPSVVAEVPSDLDGVVMKALAKAIDDRYRDARQMQMALEEFLVGQRMVASSVQIAELMSTLFADRLAEEAKAGELLPPEDAPGGVTGSDEVSKTSASRAKGPPSQWEAPAVSGAQNRVSGAGSKGMAKSYGAKAPSGDRPAPAPPPDVPSWEAPAGEVDSPRRTRTGMGEVRASDVSGGVSGGTNNGVPAGARRTETGTAIGRTPSRPELSSPGTRSGVMRTRTAIAQDDDDSVDDRGDRGDADDRVEEDPRALEEEPAPSLRRSSSGIPRTASKPQLRRMTGSNLARAVDPAADRDSSDEAPRPRVIDRSADRDDDAPPRRKTKTGELRAQSRSGEKARPSGDKPKRTMSKELRAPQLEARTADELENESLDAELFKEASKKRLQRVLMVSVMAAGALMAFVFRDAIIAFFTAVPATGQGVYLTVDTNVPVKIGVKHHKDEGKPDGIDWLVTNPVQREIRKVGAHLRDTIVLENDNIDLHQEHEITFGQPGEVVEIKREYKTGHLLLVLTPALRDIKVYNPRTNMQMGAAYMRIELSEGDHKLELRGDSLRKPQMVDVKVIAGEVTKKPVTLTNLDPSVLKNQLQ